jgi:hypothetical protein
MDSPRKIIGLGHDQGAARNRLASLRVPPLIAEARNRKHRAVCGADEIGLVAALSRPPLVIADAGTMQRVRLKAERNIGFSATVSARALKVEGTSLAVFFHQLGMRPQRIGTSSAPVAANLTTSIVVVGAML